MSADPRRALPAVDLLLRESAARELEARHGRALVLAEARRLLAETRERLAADPAEPPPDVDALVQALAARVAGALAPSLIRVINATGVVVHTNLGRAPLSPEAARRVAEIAASYSNLEYDLARGERGKREVHIEGPLVALLGVEAALVVNNNAAAVLLAINTLAEGREVLVSRGELVEIGGSFRIPEILRKGGARLVEVGTTNRTRLADFRAALSPETAMILKVHPSNFRVVGFVESTPGEDLVALAREAGLPIVEDQGSGYLSASHPALGGEETVADALARGVDLVTFSGDKLLGGPQAGIVAGRRELVDRLRKNPLYRALRVDKLTLAALDTVLAAHQAERALEAVPVARMLAATPEAIRARAEGLVRGLAAAVPGLAAEIIPGGSAVGGGAAPTLEVPTALIALAPPSPATFAAALRAGTPPVVVRIAEGRVLVDLRTVEPGDEPRLLDTLARAADTSPERR